MKFAVIGTKTQFSRSPLFQNVWLKRAQLEGTYEAINILPEALNIFLESLSVSGYRGINVTVPHKEAVYQWLKLQGAALDNIAEKTQAVNTVIIEEKGLLCGRNTDAYGFKTNIETSLLDQSIALESTTLKALVIGAGGAAKAVIVALQDLMQCQKIFLTNRTQERAEILAKQLGNLEVISWEKRDEIMKEVNFVVNCTNLGMQGSEPLEISLAQLPPTAIVTDIVYTPIITPLLEQAKNRGNPIVDGTGMLLYQGRKSFEYWTGIAPEIDQSVWQLTFPEKYSNSKLFL